MTRFVPEDITAESYNVLEREPGLQVNGSVFRSGLRCFHRDVKGSWLNPVQLCFTFHDSVAILNRSQTRISFIFVYWSVLVLQFSTAEGSILDNLYGVNAWCQPRNMTCNSYGAICRSSSFASPSINRQCHFRCALTGFRYSTLTADLSRSR